MQYQTLLVAGFAGLAAAAPAISHRQSIGTQSCEYAPSYSIQSEQSIPGSWTAVSGQACTSDAEDTCTVGASTSLSLGVTITEGANLDLESILSLSTSVSFSVTTTSSESIGETCPKGGYVCGLIYQATMVNVAGVKNLTYTGDCVLSGSLESTSGYGFTSPAMISGSPQVTYAACVSNSSPNKTLTGLDISMCPGDL
jgi:hypothetical protein